MNIAQAIESIANCKLHKNWGQTMIKLDSTDIEILFSMYGHAPDFEQIAWEMRTAKYTDVRKRLYRLSRHGLCACDKPGMHPGEPRCWSLSPEGERVVEECDESGEWHWKRDFVYEYRKAPVARRGGGGAKGERHARNSSYTMEAVK